MPFSLFLRPLGSCKKVCVCVCIAVTLRDGPHSCLLGTHHFCIYPSDIFELKALSTCLRAFSDAGAHVTYARE